MFNHTRLLPSQNGKERPMAVAVQPLAIASLAADTVYGYQLLIGEQHNGYSEHGQFTRRLAIARTLGTPYHWAVYIRPIPPEINLDEASAFSCFVEYASKNGMKQAESTANFLFPELAAAFLRAGVKYWGT